MAVSPTQFWLPMRERAQRWLTALLPRLGLATLAAVVAGWAFVNLAEAVMDRGDILAIDRLVIDYAAVYGRPQAFEFMTTVSQLSAGPVQMVLVTVVALSYAAAHRFWPAGATILLGGWGGLGVVSLLKVFYARPRPDAAFYDLGYAFPSGHSFLALTVYGLLAYWFTKDAAWPWRVLGWAVAVFATGLVGLSRVYVGEHYATDVLGGFTVALPWVWGCLTLPGAARRLRRGYRKWIRTRQEERRRRRRLRLDAPPASPDTAPE